ncbi:SAM-dependent methyltransferase [Erythromicrobium ramosum]|uniref:Methyltransferase domain-containing protein n=1 Tax=Erythrobacter ramosus TaxID=35811 RepID=A0A6I4UIH8_9SPHN|nr:SAM-dependent methyltransferase [Erythrobacter ramosus]MXP38692.1 methyltransferase domain-containing protein [Erythrobacter ramosus]
MFQTHDHFGGYASAREIGCAHGVLTQRLHRLCDQLLAIDISQTALALTQQRLGTKAGLEFAQMGFPTEAPRGLFDLCVMSEVAYYWDADDLSRAAQWLADHLVPDGRVVLVHYTGETDYPCTADEAVGALQGGTSGQFTTCLAERQETYRLDLWVRR